MPNPPRTSGLRAVVLAALALLGLVPALQAAPTELYFSEYIEGSSKRIEAGGATLRPQLFGESRGILPSIAAFSK
jgi:hypothetical protein